MAAADPPPPLLDAERTRCGTCGALPRDWPPRAATRACCRPDAPAQAELGRTKAYPKRPDEQTCLSYVRLGRCPGMERSGWCHFHHPPFAEVRADTVASAAPRCQVCTLLMPCVVHFPSIGALVEGLEVDHVRFGIAPPASPPTSTDAPASAPGSHVSRPSRGSSVGTPASRGSSAALSQVVSAASRGRHAASAASSRGSVVASSERPGTQQDPVPEAEAPEPLPQPPPLRELEIVAAPFRNAMRYSYVVADNLEAGVCQIMCQLPPEPPRCITMPRERVVPLHRQRFRGPLLRSAATPASRSPTQDPPATQDRPN